MADCLCHKINGGFALNWFVRVGLKRALVGICMKAIKYQVVVDVVFLEVVPEIVDDITVDVLVDSDFASQEADVLLEVSLDVHGVSVVGLGASLKDFSLRVSAADKEVA